MPFITKERRHIIASSEGTPLLPGGMQPGDLCYIAYKTMVEEWEKEPRWTTAHHIYKRVFTGICDTLDEGIATELAWQVFFQIHVMPYEERKRRENGDI